MWFLYMLACLPAVAGGVQWIRSKQITWWEVLAGLAAAFLVVGISHGCAMYGLTSDIETWSGQVTQVAHHPRWVERYTTTVTTTDGKGHTRTRTETHYRTHPERWVAHDSIPQGLDIDAGTYHAHATVLGGQVTTTTPYKSGFHSGDRNVYAVKNTTGACLPTTARRHFENRVKAAPSVFSFAKVSEGTKVFAYPANGNPFQSDRLLGTAVRDMPIVAWDQLNARLGPSKWVNLILVGFGDADSQMGHWQEAKWIGGRKNDVVLCYGGDPKQPAWTYVFGWTEQEIVKRNLESLLLEQGVGVRVLPAIEAEVRARYVIKDWDKFSYISVEPPGWAYVVLFFVLVVTQVGFWLWAHYNEWGKEARHTPARSWYKSTGWPV
jgi:hypothetical protein